MENNRPIVSRRDNQQPSSSSSQSTGSMSTTASENISESNENNVNGNDQLPWICTTETLLSTLPKKPVYAGSCDINPVKFLEQLERYFCRLSISENRRLELTIDCLE